MFELTSRLSEQKITPLSFIAAMRSAGFTGYSRPLHSMACKPEKYGLALCPSAAKKMNARFKPTGGSVRNAGDDLPRVTARLPSEQYARFKTALNANGETMQDALAEMVSDYIKRGVSCDENGLQGG